MSDNEVAHGYYISFAPTYVFFRPVILTLAQLSGAKRE
jgi:hypothetical protein